MKVSTFYSRSIQNHVRIGVKPPDISREIRRVLETGSNYVYGFDSA